MKKIKMIIYNFIKNDGITLLVVLLVTFFVVKYTGKSPSDIIDLTILTLIIVAFLLNTITVFIKRKVLNWLEDDIKLTTDYESLSKSTLIK